MLELVGKGRPRRGPARAVVAKRRDQIPSDKFPPYWRDVMDEMWDAYHGLCAYLAMYIEPATGSASVDHVVPRSHSWRLVYEWSNYRLAASLINGKKSDLELVLDPFKIKPGTFGLEFVTMEVVPGRAVAGSMRRKAEETISTLGLNLPDCVDQRSSYFVDYKRVEISLAYLTRRAPFIASELRLQGKLNPGDV